MTASEPSLGRRMAVGGAWLVTLRFAMRGLGVISTLVLARLLVPEDFGLIALVSIIVEIFDAMSNFSLEAALVRDQKARREHYDTAWTLLVIKQALIALVLIAGAGLAADFFRDPRLESIIYVIAAGVALDGFCNIGTVDFTKNFQFDKQFFYVLIPKVGSFAVTVSLAFIWRDYWALVIGSISARVIRLGLSYAIHPYIPRFSLQKTYELLNFSKWLLFNNIAGYLGARLETFVIGRLMTPQAVGLFTIAGEIAHLASTEILNPVTAAVLPGYARLQEARERLVESYLRTTGLVVMLGLPMAIGTAAIADLLVEIALGPNWLAAIPLIKIMAFTAMLRVCIANTATIYIVVGKPYLVGYVTVAAIVFYTPLLLWSVMNYGLVGAAWSGAVAACFFVLIHLVLVVRVLDLRLWQILIVYWRPSLAAAVMYFAVTLTSSAWPISPEFFLRLIKLLALVVIGITVYLGVVLMIWQMVGRRAGAEEDALQILSIIRHRLSLLFNKTSDPLK